MQRHHISEVADRTTSDAEHQVLNDLKLAGVFWDETEDPLRPTAREDYSLRKQIQLE